MSPPGDVTPPVTSIRALVGTTTTVATVTRVIDGDTIRADVVLGTLTLGSIALDVVARATKVRLAGCNAAEVGTPAGAAARSHLIGRLPPGTLLHLDDLEDYKYGGEVIARVTTVPDGVDLAAELIAQQWAASWDGRGPRPTPPWPRE